MIFRSRKVRALDLVHQTMINFNKHLHFSSFKLNKDDLYRDSLNGTNWMFECHKHRLIITDELISSDSSRAAHKRFMLKLKKISSRYNYILSGLND